MAHPPPPHAPLTKSRPLDPFRRAVLRGLGVLLPPLLTIVIFLWVGNTVARYVLTPLEDCTRYVLVEYTSDIRAENEFTNPPKIAGEAVKSSDDILFRRTGDGLYIPDSVYAAASNTSVQSDLKQASAKEFYTQYVNEVWLQPWLVIPIFLAVFLLLLYAFGKFLAAGIGRFFWGQIESLITRVPLVSNVYTSVKQVTDFLFTDPDLDITRVVAVEYPRKGIWTIAFVTGESMLDIESAANEPVQSVLIPTSPMPFTGFTITVKKSESIDLNITIDQAFQFIVSCGVVIPPQQQRPEGHALRFRSRVRPPESVSDSSVASGMSLPPSAGVAHQNGHDTNNQDTVENRAEEPSSSGDDGKTEGPAKEE